MPRKPRLEFPGAIYHINHRGNHQEYIYLDDDDRMLFLKLLQTTIQRMNWICHAYCLMGNHYHLLIEIPEGILSRGMAWLNSVYTQKFNRKYDTSGHLFQGRFKSKPVEDNMQFLMAARYVVRNPLQANLVERADQWPWSSYRATAGLINTSDYLFINDVLSCLGTNRSMAQLYYRELVHLRIRITMMRLLSCSRRCMYRIESLYFKKKRARTVMDMKNSQGPIPRSQRILARPSLSELFDGKGEGDLETRNKIIHEAFTHYAFTQSELADYLSVTRSAISKIVCKT